MKEKQPKQSPEEIRDYGRLVLTIKRSRLQRLSDYLYGYDYFISYRWSDGRDYAIRLAQALKSKGYNCFLDSKEFWPGENWALGGRLALRKTNRLALIVTRGAIVDPNLNRKPEDDPILQELKAFEESQRHKVRIILDPIEDGAWEGSGIAGFFHKHDLFLDDIGSRLSGPSSATIDELDRLANLEKRDRGRIRFLQILTSIFVVLTIAAAVASGIAFEQRQTALKRTKQAEFQEEKANEKVAEAAIKSFSASRQAFETQNHEVGFARLAEALRYNQELPVEAQIRSISIDAKMRILYLQNTNPIPLLQLRDFPAKVRRTRFSPDGQWILTELEDQYDYSRQKNVEDRSARLWDAESGKAVGQPVPHYGWIHEVMFSPDGMRALAFPDKKTVTIWKVPNGEIVGEPLVLDSELKSARFTSGGGRIVTISEREIEIPEFPGLAKVTVVRRWVGTTGTPIGDPLEVNGSVTPHGISADGKWVLELISADPFSPTVRYQLWNLEKKKVFMEIAEPVSDQVFAGEAEVIGEWTVTYNEGPRGIREVKISSNHTGDIVFPLRQDRETSGERLAHAGEAFSSDGKLIVSWRDNREIFEGVPLGNRQHENEVRIWEADNGSQIGPVLFHKDGVQSAGFSRDGTRLITLSGGKKVTIWSVPENRQVGMPLRHAGELFHFSGDGKRVSTATSGTITTDSGLEEWPPNGESETARVWELASGKPVGDPFDIRFGVRALLNSDGRRVFVENGKERAIRLVETGEPIGSPVKPGRWPGNENHEFNAREFGTQQEIMDRLLEFLNTSTGEFRTEFQGGTSYGDAMGRPREVESGWFVYDYLVEVAEFSPDGIWVATAKGNQAQIWRVENGERVGTPLEHPRDVRSMAFSRDGTQVATVDHGGGVKVWSLPNVRLEMMMTTTGGVSSVLFSRDGNCLLCETEDGRPLIIDVEAGLSLPLAEFSADSDRPDIWNRERVGRRTRFSPDEKWVVGNFATMDYPRVWEINLDGSESAQPEDVEMFGGWRIDDSGNLAPLPVLERVAWRNRVRERPENGLFWNRLVAWSVASLGSRVISPSSEVSIDEFIRRSIDRVMENPIEVLDPLDWEIRTYIDRPKVLREAYRLNPGHPLIHIAMASIEKDGELAAFYRDYGLKRLPSDARICARASEILGKQGDWIRAKIAAEKAVEADPDLPEARKALLEVDAKKDVNNLIPKK